MTSWKFDDVMLKDQWLFWIMYDVNHCTTYIHVRVDKICTLQYCMMQWHSRLLNPLKIELKINCDHWHWWASWVFTNANEKFSSDNSETSIWVTSVVWHDWADWVQESPGRATNLSPSLNYVVCMIITGIVSMIWFNLT